MELNMHFTTSLVRKLGISEPKNFLNSEIDEKK